tara:strand:+ start:1842 stop:2714 length:873 start_codon:yes stop_codon:yes gene_type:complete
MNKKLFAELTIVIASVVNKLSHEWINQINIFANNGISIIISIPPEIPVEDVYKRGFDKKVNIINSDLIGQVNQRYFAHKHSNTKFIMNMDDDIYIDLNNLNNLLVQYSKLPYKSCLAPKLFQSGKRNKESRLLALFRNIFIYSSVLTPKAGSVACTSFPVPHRFNIDPSIKKYEEVDWLPGGILILHRSDLLDYRYYKFRGKAYCEDLIFSFLIKNKGLRLYLATDSYYSTPEHQYYNLSGSEFINFIYHDFIARNYYRRLRNFPFINLLIAYFGISINYLINKLISLSK